MTSEGASRGLRRWHAPARHLRAGALISALVITAGCSTQDLDAARVPEGAPSPQRTGFSDSSSSEEATSVEEWAFLHADVLDRLEAGLANVEQAHQAPADSDEELTSRLASLGEATKQYVQAAGDVEALPDADLEALFDSTLAEIDEHLDAIIINTAGYDETARTDSLKRAADSAAKLRSFRKALAAAAEAELAPETSAPVEPAEDSRLEVLERDAATLEDARRFTRAWNEAAGVIVTAFRDDAVSAEEFLEVAPPEVSELEAAADGLARTYLALEDPEVAEVMRRIGNSYRAKLLEVQSLVAAVERDDQDAQQAAAAELGNLGEKSQRLARELMQVFVTAGVQLDGPPFDES